MKKYIYDCMVAWKEDIDLHKTEYENSPIEFAEKYGEPRLIFGGNENELPDGYEDDDIFYYLDGVSIEHLLGVNNGEDFIVLDYFKL